MHVMLPNAPMKPLLSRFTDGGHLIALIGLPVNSRIAKRSTDVSPANSKKRRLACDIINVPQNIDENSLIL